MVDLFYHSIMGKIGPKFSQIVSVRLEGGDPPHAISLTAFSQLFLTASLILLGEVAWFLLLQCDLFLYILTGCHVCAWTDTHNIVLESC